MPKIIKSVNCLQKKYNTSNSNIMEIGIDEAGRGPMFGRVYSAAVILPNNEEFKYELLKDSKKFTSEKKINEVADYIKTNALFWSVSYEDEKTIDSINNLQVNSSITVYVCDDASYNKAIKVHSNVEKINCHPKHLPLATVQTFQNWFNINGSEDEIIVFNDK